VSFSDLKARVVSGAFLVAGAQLARQLVQLGAVAVLARLIVPADFGLVALAVGVLAFVQVLSDFGLGAALEREIDLAPAVESRLFRLNLLAALVVAAIVMVAAPAFARLFGQPELAFVVRVLAFPFLVASTVRTRTSVLARQLRFGRLGAVEVVPVVLGTTISVTLAYRGWGAMALVAGSAVQQLAWSAGAVLAAGVPSAAPAPLRTVVPLIRFGGSFALFQIVNTTARKLDDLLVGGLMGIAALGLYEKSYALMMIPVAYLAGASSRVLYPSLARVRNDPAQFRFLYLGAVRKLAGLSFPVAAVCAAAAGPVVRLLLGPRFEAAIPIFGVLALSMGLQPLLSIGGVVYMARARMRLFVAVSTGATIVLAAAYVIGAHQGSPLAMAKGFTAAYLVVFVPLMSVALRVAGATWREFLERVAAPAVAAIVAWAVGVAVAGFGVAVQFPAMGITYLGVHWIIDRDALLDLFRFLDPRRVVVGAAVAEPREAPPTDDAPVECGQRR